MRIDKLAVTAQEAFQTAFSIASDNESATMDSMHLLKALLDADENNIDAIIERVGASADAINASITAEIEKQP